MMAAPMPPRYRLATAALALTALLATAGCGTPRQTAAQPGALPDSLARQRGVLTVSGDEGGFPELPPPIPGARESIRAIHEVLDAQVEAWNAGDIRGFMSGYAGTDSLMFISNGQRRAGWQAALYAYMRNYPDRASMGTLSFEDLDINMLAENAALVHGLYRLRRANDEPIGLFTLVFHRDVAGRWRIIHDHTSSDD
jgi:ketosteroid isomerase-like protein